MCRGLMIFGLVLALMMVGVTLLSGYVFPLALHYVLKPFALDQWVNCGTDYTTVAYIARAPDEALRMRWWEDLTLDAKEQLSALPLFVALAATSAIGVALWIALCARPAPLWFAAILGAFPGFVLVVVFVGVNSFAMVEASPPINGEKGALLQSVDAVMWSWLVSRSFLVAAGAMACAWIANRLTRPQSDRPL